MASLKKRNADYQTNTSKMHVLSESGTDPLFCRIDKTGEHHAVNGSWSLPNVNKLEAFRMIRQTPDGDVAIEAIPPKCGKDEKVIPMTLTIRNIQSPDAERFRIENGLDAVKESINPKLLEESTLTPEQRRRITVGSCIVGFTGMVADDGNGKGIAMPFNSKNLLTLLEDYEPVLIQADLFAGETKKFESSS